MERLHGGARCCRDAARKIARRCRQVSAKACELQSELLYFGLMSKACKSVHHDMSLVLQLMQLHPSRQHLFRQPCHQHCTDKRTAEDTDACKLIHSVTLVMAQSQTQGSGAGPRAMPLPFIEIVEILPQGV